MATGIIGRALAGAGGAIKDVGIEQLRAQILAERDARLNSYQTERDDRTMAHQSRENEANRSLTREEGAAGRAVTTEQGELTREHQTNLQKTSLEHAAEQHAATREHQSTEAQLTREHQAAEGDKSRKIQSASLGIQAKQLEITAKGAELEREIKTIALENAKELKNLRTEYKTETDPAKRARIEQNIQILTGKDNDSYLPVPLKDETGAITGYQIFDKKRGAFVDTPGSTKPPSPADIDGLRKRADNPQAIAFFESKFGAGSAAKYVEQAKGGAKAAAPTPGGRSGAAGLQAQIDFDADVQSLQPQQLVEKYSSLEASLTMPQQAKLAEAKKAVPKRVPLVSR